MNQSETAALSTVGVTITLVAWLIEAHMKPPMIDDKDRIPFLARFANPLPEKTAELIGYDENRQVAQVHFDGNWGHARKAPRMSGMTRVTKVRNETTDDE